MSTKPVAVTAAAAANPVPVVHSKALEAKWTAVQASISKHRALCDATALQFAKMKMDVAQDAFLKLEAEKTALITRISTINSAVPDAGVSIKEDVIAADIAALDDRHKTLTRQFLQVFPHAPINSGPPCIGALRAWNAADAARYPVVKKLSNSFPVNRPIRDEGNLFYTAFTALYFSSLCHTSKLKEFAEVMERDKTLDAGIKEAMKGTLAHLSANPRDHLEPVLASNQRVLPFVHFFRRQVSSYIQAHPTQFKGIASDASHAKKSLKEYCIVAIEEFGVDAQEEAMQALLEVYNFPMEMLDVTMATQEKGTTVLKKGLPQGIFCLQDREIFVIHPHIQAAAKPAPKPVVPPTAGTAPSKTGELKPGVPPAAATAAAKPAAETKVVPKVVKPFAEELLAAMLPIEIALKGGDLTTALQKFGALPKPAFEKITGKVYGHMYWHHVQLGKRKVEDAEYGRHAFNPAPTDTRNFGTTSAERLEVIQRACIDVLLDGLEEALRTEQPALVLAHLEMLKQKASGKEGALYGKLYHVLKDESKLPKPQWDFMESGRLLFRDEANHKIDKKWKLRAVELLRNDLKAEWGIK